MFELLADPSDVVGADSWIKLQERVNKKNLKKKVKVISKRNNKRVRFRHLKRKKPKVISACKKRKAK